MLSDPPLRVWRSFWRIQSQFQPVTPWRTCNPIPHCRDHCLQVFEEFDTGMEVYGLERTYVTRPITTIRRDCTGTSRVPPTLTSTGGVPNGIVGDTRLWPMERRKEREDVGVGQNTKHTFSLTWGVGGGRQRLKDGDTEEREEENNSYGRVKGSKRGWS